MAKGLMENATTGPLKTNWNANQERNRGGKEKGQNKKKGQNKERG